MRYITGGIPWTDEQVRRFVDRQVELYADRGFCRWRVLDAASGGLMGFCGVGFWGQELDPEIGWWLARRHWGRGFATEAAQCALRDIFGRVGLEGVISVAEAGNTASRRVMEKLGMRLECEFQREGLGLVRYKILHAEYARGSCFDV
jgi:RimJ/RimL family protein N-acetyltransferase